MRLNKTTAFLHLDYISNFTRFCVPSSLPFGCPTLFFCECWQPEREGVAVCVCADASPSRTSALEPPWGLAENHRNKIKSWTVPSTQGPLMLYLLLSLLFSPRLQSALPEFIPRSLLPGIAVLRPKEETRSSEAPSSDGGSTMVLEVSESEVAPHTWPGLRGAGSLSVTLPCCGAVKGPGWAPGPCFFTVQVTKSVSEVKFFHCDVPASGIFLPVHVM